MQRLASLTLAAALLLPSAAGASSPETLPAPPARSSASGPATDAKLAEAKVSEAEAAAIARKFFAIPADLGEPNINLSRSQQYATYTLVWETPGKKPERVTYHVEVDGINGSVISYSRWESGREGQGGDLRFTRREAETIAREWLAKLAPDALESLRYVDNPLSSWYYGGSASYEFAWEGLVEGYPFIGQGVRISVSARTGELDGYNRTRSEAGLRFTVPESLLSAEQAAAVYREKLLMVLQYQRFTKPGTDQSEWRLVYTPLAGYPAVTQDGRLVGSDGKELNLERLKEQTVVPASDKPYVAPIRMLSQEEALRLARNVSGRTEEPWNIRFSTYGDEQKIRTYEISWRTPGETPEEEIHSEVRVDADRGVIVNFYTYGPYRAVKETDEPALTEAEARAVAIEFLRTHRPDLAGSVMLNPSERDLIDGKMPGGQGAVYYIRFTHLKHGIPVVHYSGSVEVDARTGKVRSLWGDLPATKDQFPAPEGLIPAADAVELFLKHQGLEQGWTIFQDYSGTKSQPERSEPQLVYMPGRSLNISMVDAKLGVPVDYQGRDLLEAMKRPVDIQGHFAQREIELLWARGVFELKEGMFHPQQQVTAAEFARWLVLARGMRPYASYDFRDAMGLGGAGVAARLEKSADAPYLGAAFQAGIMLPEDFAADASPDGTVSRELAALWAVRAMGYGAIARMENRIAMPFADREAVGARYANAVAILHGLGVVKGGPDGQFYPQRQLTRGEAARILFAVASEVRR